MKLSEPDAALDELARQVIGAAIAVHRLLGPGYLESAYENAMGIELELRRIEHRRQVPIPVDYKGTVVSEYRLDLLVSGRLVVELKAVDALATVHAAQVRAYLKASGCMLGLLINFNVRWLRDGIQRVISSR